MQKSKIVLVVGIIFIICGVFATMGLAVLHQHKQATNTPFITVLLYYFVGISLITLWGFIKKSKQ